MRKKDIWLIVTVVVVVFVLIPWAIYAIAYPYASRMVDKATRQGFIEECKEYLSSNDDFADSYGTIVSLEPENDMPIKDKESELDVYYMDFVCITDRGEYYIRVNHIWNDGWSFSYEEIYPI